MGAPTGGAGDAHEAPRTAARIEDNTSSRSYHVLVDGQIAGTIVCERTGVGRISLHPHRGNRQFRGLGVGTALVQGALHDVRAKGLTLTNFCDFVGRYIQAHPDYRGLLDPQHPGHVLGGH